LVLEKRRGKGCVQFSEVPKVYKRKAKRIKVPRSFHEAAEPEKNQIGLIQDEGGGNLGSAKQQKKVGGGDHARKAKDCPSL